MSDVFVLMGPVRWWLMRLLGLAWLALTVLCTWRAIAGDMHPVSAMIVGSFLPWDASAIAQWVRIEIARHRRRAAAFDALAREGRS